MKLDFSKRRATGGGFLEGQMLLAMPAMADSRFARSLIYLCAHSDEGAMGIVINQRVRRPTFSDLLVQLDVIKEEEAIRLPTSIGAIQVLKGGPVETGRGFVLHSADFSRDSSTLLIDRDVCLTATIDILRAIAAGDGPQEAVLALGYAGWGPGQLEAEMQSNSWLTCPADGRLIFDTDVDSKYTRAMQAIGIDPAMLSSAAGRA
jgi:putative transcriptional regulator